MNVYVIYPLSSKSVRVVAHFWMKADAYGWLNSFPEAAKKYRVIEHPDRLIPGEIINFPEV